MEPSISGQTGTDTAADIKKDSVWQKTSYANLLRYKPSKVYFARIRIHGKLIRRSLETQSLTVAKLRLADLEKKERQIAENHARTATGKMTFGDALAVYRKRLHGGQTDARKSGSKEYREERISALLKSWPTLEKTDVRKITKADCLNWASDYQGKFSATNYNNTKDSLKLVLDIAVELGARYDNPARFIKRAKVMAKEPKLPSQDDFEKVLATIKHKSVADLVRFAAYSGMRIGEIRNVAWEDIDFAKKQINVRGDKETGTKNWEQRHLPMIPEMRVLLERLRDEKPNRKPEDAVMDKKEFRGSVRTACNKLGISYFNHHAMRHYFITRCMELNVPIKTLAKWSGHKDGGALILKRYSHVRPEHEAEIAEGIFFSTPKPEVAV